MLKRGEYDVWGMFSKKVKVGRKLIAPKYLKNKFDGNKRGGERGLKKEDKEKQ